MITNILSSARQFLETHLTMTSGDLIMDLLLMPVIAIVAIAVYYLTKGILYFVEILVERTPTTWDDDLITYRLMRAIAQLAPAIVVNHLLPTLFVESPTTHHWAKIFTAFYILWAVVHLMVVFTGNLYNAFSHRDKLRRYAVKGVFQMIKLIFIGVGVVVGASILVGKSPTAILTAIGASAAVLMLVFKDTIMGLVASVQLTANNMLRRGDWIVADSHGINGEVEDVNLTTIKVRNWDNSISTIPPYSLVSDSFRNYQAMHDSGGRRVERSILIDINSVRFLSAEEIESLRNRGHLQGIPPEKIQCGINIQLLRYSLEHFLTHDDRVNHKMTTMVRQLQPTATGLPLQMYFFTQCTAWIEFERIQSDIMDHVYALAREFGITLFQSPAGSDITPLHKS
ncbi:MAG: mechanosensitive ion channel family protein [Paramuribaculum sp.]|nr:mechanosensitive ion channel family protein [Paramuribaculum sp.]